MKGSSSVAPASVAPHGALESPALPVSAADLQLAISPCRASTWGPSSSVPLGPPLLLPLEGGAPAENPSSAGGERLPR